MFLMKVEGKTEPRPGRMTKPSKIRLEITETCHKNMAGGLISGKQEPCLLGCLAVS